MEFSDPLVIGPVVGVAIGLGVYFAHQGRQSKDIGDRIRKELATAESLSLPELVVRLGLKDGFMSRGKVMGVLNPMVASGEVLQEEPPGTTMNDRLDVLRVRLRVRS